MRGRSKTLPKYRKHKASGQAIVTIAGKMHYLGPHDTKASRAEYDRLIGQWLANGRQALNDQIESEKLSITNLCAAYWRFSKTYYVKDGEATDEQAGIKAAIKALKNLYGQTSAAKFGPLALEAVRQQMIESGNSRKYINQNIGRIKRMFRWGVSKELIPVEAYQRLQTVPGLKKGKSKAVETSAILPIDDAIVEATIKHVNSTVADMIRIQRYTGCRPGEICSMKPAEIDRSKEVWQYWPKSHKMEYRERHRVILIGPRAQAILTKYLLKPDDEHCFIRRGKQPYKRLHFHQHIMRGCDKAFPAPDGLTADETDKWRKDHRWAPNRLRHSAGTDIRAKFGIEASQVVLGHSKIETTQVYAERDISKASKIMWEVG